MLRELWTGDRPPGARDAPDKIRILAVSASPPGFEQLDTQRERAQIRAVIDAHETAAELTWIDDCTYDLLHEALGENPQVLHFVGHSFCDDNGDAGLILAKADGSVHQVSALAFTNLLDRADSLDLIVLNSCEGFRAVDGHPYASLAAKIVRASQGAVIAMQFKITDDAAIKFSGELYKRLIRDRYSIDRAMSEARTAVMGVNEIEFATPVLYLRDGRTDLFAAVGEASDTTLVPNAVTTNAAPARTSHLGVRVLSLQLPNLVGDDIAELQTRLRRVGVDTGPVDGLYGPRTTQAVQDFQSTAGLVVDGVCGETTIEALDARRARRRRATGCDRRARSSRPRLRARTRPEGAAGDSGAVRHSCDTSPFDDQGRVDRRRRGSGGVPRARSVHRSQRRRFDVCRELDGRSIDVRSRRRRGDHGSARARHGIERSGDRRRGSDRDHRRPSRSAGPAALRRATVGTDTRFRRRLRCVRVGQRERSDGQ